MNDSSSPQHATTLREIAEEMGVIFQTLRTYEVPKTEAAKCAFSLVLNWLSLRSVDPPVSTEPENTPPTTGFQA